MIDAEPPIRNVERNVGAGGRRVATGTYTLDQLPNDGTRINFQYAWQQTPLRERLAAPIVRRVTRTALQTAMNRLAEQLQAHHADQAHRAWGPGAARVRTDCRCGPTLR